MESMAKNPTLRRWNQSPDSLLEQRASTTAFIRARGNMWEIIYGSRRQWPLIVRRICVGWGSHSNVPSTPTCMARVCGPPWEVPSSSWWPSPSDILHVTIFVGIFLDFRTCTLTYHICIYIENNISLESFHSPK